MLQKSLNFVRWYLLFCVITNVSLLVIFVSAVVYFSMPREHLTLVVATFFRSIQIILWMWSISYLCSNKKIGSFSLKLVSLKWFFVATFCLDIARAVLALTVDVGTPVNWTSATEGFEGQFPAMVSVINLYSDYGTLLNVLIKMLDPIPYGVAALIWPLLFLVDQKKTSQD